MSNTTEYKDKAGEWQLRHRHTNGNITLATTEGYKNRLDMRESMINACIGVLSHYRQELTGEQIEDIERLIYND